MQLRHWWLQKISNEIMGHSAAAFFCWNDILSRSLRHVLPSNDGFMVSVAQSVHSWLPSVHIITMAMNCSRCLKFLQGQRTEWTTTSYLFLPWNEWSQTRATKCVDGKRGMVPPGKDAPTYVITVWIESPGLSIQQLHTMKNLLKTVLKRENPSFLSLSCIRGRQCSLRYVGAFCWNPGLVTEVYFSSAFLLFSLDFKWKILESTDLVVGDENSGREQVTVVTSGKYDY